MDVNYEKVADDLVENSYAFVPIDTVLVNNAMGATQKLLRTLGDVKRWALTRDGEHEADVGHITKRYKDGYDEKTYFHFALDLPLLLDNAGVRESAQQKACLQIIEQLHMGLRSIALNIVTALQVPERELLSFATDGLMRNTFRLHEPYNTSVLRYLEYPDINHQTGAREHYDKSLLSIHLGDDGGELYAFDRSGEWVAISPPPGMAVVFFGVKILYATDGKLLPLKHKSTTVPGRMRTAMVMFAHADVEHQVTDSQKSHDEFYANR